MVEPDHDAARDKRSHRPVGMVNPVDISPLQSHPAMDTQVLFQEREMRVQQIFHALRTAMETVVLPVNQQLLTNGPGDAQAWNSARTAVFSGAEYMDRSDPYVLAWDTGSRKLIASFLAGAQFKFSDFAHIDLRDIFRRAVAAVYGEQAAISMTPAPATNHSLVQPPGNGDAQTLRERQLAYGRIQNGQPKRMTTRFHSSVKWQIRVGLVTLPATMVLLDSGSDVDHFQRKVLQDAWYSATSSDLPTESIEVLNITGARSTISRLTERSEITLMPDTPQQMTVSSRLALMDGAELPTLIIGAPTAGRMMMRLDLGRWHVEYTNMPWLAHPPRHFLRLRGCPPRVQQQSSAVSALPRSYIPIRHYGLTAYVLDSAFAATASHRQGPTLRFSPSVHIEEYDDPHMPQLLLMSGDVESNPGPSHSGTDEDDSGADDDMAAADSNGGTDQDEGVDEDMDSIGSDSGGTESLPESTDNATDYGCWELLNSRTEYFSPSYFNTTSRMGSLNATREHGSLAETADRMNRADKRCIVQGSDGDPLSRNWVPHARVSDLREIHGGAACREPAPKPCPGIYPVTRLRHLCPAINEFWVHRAQPPGRIDFPFIHLTVSYYRRGLHRSDTISARDLPSMLPEPLPLLRGPTLYRHEAAAGDHPADGNHSNDKGFHMRGIPFGTQRFLWALRPPSPRPRMYYSHHVTTNLQFSLTSSVKLCHPSHQLQNSDHDLGPADGIIYGNYCYGTGHVYDLHRDPPRNGPGPPLYVSHYTPSATIYIDPVRPSPLNTFSYQVSREAPELIPLSDLQQIQLMQCQDPPESQYLTAFTDNRLAAQHYHSCFYSLSTEWLNADKLSDYPQRHQAGVYTHVARITNAADSCEVDDDHEFLPGCPQWTVLVNLAARRQAIHSSIVSLLLQKCRSISRQLHLLHCLAVDAPNEEHPHAFSYHNWRGVGRMWRAVLPTAYAQLQAIRAKAPDMRTPSSPRAQPRHHIVSHLALHSGVTPDIVECFIMLMGVSETSSGPDASELQLLALPEITSMLPPPTTLTSYAHARTRAQGYSARDGTKTAYGASAMDTSDQSDGLDEYPVRWVDDQTRTGMGAHFADFIVRSFCVDHHHRHICLWYDPKHHQVTVPYLIVDASGPECRPLPCVQRACM